VEWDGYTEQGESEGGEGPDDANETTADGVQGCVTILSVALLSGCDIILHLIFSKHDIGCHYRRSGLMRVHEAAAQCEITSASVKHCCDPYVKWGPWFRAVPPQLLDRHMVLERYEYCEVEAQQRAVCDQFYQNEYSSKARACFRYRLSVARWIQ